MTLQERAANLIEEEVTLDPFGIKRKILLIEPLLPVSLPTHWRLIRVEDDGYAYTYEPPGARRLKVIASTAVEDDGKRWLHISVSKWSSNPNSKRPIELPSWEELTMVRNLFLGRDVTALQVLAPEAKHVNLNEVLHLWVCLDGDVTPDFTSGTGSI